MAWETVDTEYTISPEILRLRESNDAPSDAQAQKLDSFRTLCRGEVDVLDDRIADLNAELAWLLDQRSLRESQAAVCTSLLSPFRRLPTEILGEIFLHCLPESRCRTPSRHQAPLLLGQVCSRWRGIALGMSKLWEDFMMHVNYESPDSDGSTALRHGNVAREWMSRVGEKALINYTCEVELSTETCEEAPELISHILLPYTHRLRRLDLRSWDAADFGAFLTLPSDRLPHLESAFLRFDLGETGSEPTVFANAPRLQRVSLMSLSLVTDPTVLFPWAQLTHLTVAGIQPVKWATLFRQCTTLQHGVFILQETSQFDSPASTTFDNTIFPSLTTLRMVHCNNAEQMSSSSVQKPPTWLFENLEFPALTHFDLSLEDGKCGFNVRTMRRPPLLTSLSVSNSAISTEDLIVLLCESPGIRNLELRNHDDCLKMFTRLTRDPIHAKSMLYLPKLEKLVIHAGPTSDLPYDSFSNMIRSRWLVAPLQQQIYNIRHAALFVSREWIDALVEVQLSLQQYENQGLELELKVMPLSYWDVQSREGYMEC